MTAQQSDRPQPFASAFDAYWSAGWPAPIPVIGKHPPPEGWTGASGAWPSYADVTSWSETHGGQNIALRLPPDVIGIDVDNYSTKSGGATFADCEKRWGSLPQTWRSTSRDDGVSGIRLYIIPSGLSWPGQLPGGGVELILWSHRYVVCWPSVHPEGRTYRWTKDGVTSLSIPKPGELPKLPVDWILGLTRGPERHENKADVAGVPWISALPGAHNAPCQVMLTKAAKAHADLRGDSRHDNMIGHQLDLVRLADNGHPGIVPILDALGTSYVQAVAADRQGGESVAREEYLRALNGAAQRVAASPEWPRMKSDPCTIGTLARVERAEPTLAATVLPPDAPTPPGEALPMDTSTWDRIGLRVTLAGQMEEDPPTELGRADGVTVFYPGKVNGLFGPSESGKSWIALLAAAQAIRAGRTVAVLDFEDTARTFVQRLRALDVPDEAIAEQVDYRSPADPLTGTRLAKLVAELAEFRPGLVVVDGVNAAMTLMGLELNSNKDATYFHQTLLVALTKCGGAVVVVDHTPKNEIEGMGKGAIGAQAKRAAITGVAIKVEVIKQFSRGHSGLVKLTVDKDRGGHVRMASTGAGVFGLAHLEPGEDGALIVRIEAEEESVGEDGRFRPTIYMERVADYLVDHPGTSRSQILKDVEGRRDMIHLALVQMVKEGYISTAAGARKAVLHTLVRPFPEHPSPPFPTLPQGEADPPFPGTLSGPLGPQGAGRGQVGGQGRIDFDGEGGMGQFDFDPEDGDA